MVQTNIEKKKERLTITGHARLTGDTSGDEDNLGALESIAETRVRGVVASNDAVGVDVAQIGRDTFSRTTISPVVHMKRTMPRRKKEKTYQDHP